MKVLIGHIGRLPNIKGDADIRRASSDSFIIYNKSSDSALGFSASGSTNNGATVQFTSNTSYFGTMVFNANTNNKIYQDNALPESKSLSLKYWLRNA